MAKRKPQVPATPTVQFQTVLDALLEGCQVIGYDYRYLYLNKVAAAQGKQTVEALVGRTMMEAYPGIEETAVFGTIRDCLTDRAPRHLDTEFTFPDGSTGWFQLSIEPVPEGVLILSVDITARKQGALALQRSEARYRALLQGLPDQVFVHDAAGVYLDGHVPVEQVLPIPPAELPGRQLEAVLPAEVAVRYRAALQEALTANAARTLEYELETPAGKSRFEAVFVPTDADRVTAVVRDVTVRHALEAQLRQAQKMEAVGQLTGGIAHDFNNLLTVILTNGELILLDLPETSPVRSDLEELLRAANRGASMIGRLLRFSRQSLLVQEVLDPAEVIRGLTGVLRRVLPATIDVQVRVGDMAGRIQGDRGAIEQALVNLCTNARDAMQEGGVLQIRCERTALDAGYHGTHPWVVPGDYVAIVVEDTGSGMDEVTQRRVFEPFFTTKPAGIGTGLGLAMVYGIMKQHRGMVHVYSEVGRGTVVKLYFPLADAAGQPRRRPTPRPTRPPAMGGGVTVLLAEDEESIRRVTRRALETQGYQVIVAADGEEALELFRTRRAEIGLIITDMVMPRLGGRQLAEALRENGDHVPILFTSGYSPSAAREQSPLPAGTAFLHKPWTLADLFAKVEETLGRPPGGPEGP